MATHCAQEEEKGGWEMPSQLSLSRGDIAGDFRNRNVSKESDLLSNTDHDSECIVTEAWKKWGEGSIKVGFD